MATLRERLAAWLQPESYAVELRNGTVVFFEARRARIRRDGRLVFWSWWTLVGAIETGEWIRFQAGLTPDDLGSNQ